MIRALLALMLLAAPAFAQTSDETAFARGLLNSIQEQSFEEGREYCGYIGYRADGTLAATKPRRGREASCLIWRWPRTLDVVASYHTHGNFNSAYFNETPSVEDVLGDNGAGIDGYVATPGGRLWYVDGETGAVRQLCRPGCMKVDPGFVAGQEGPVAMRYSFDELIDRFSN
ncbi:MAG: DUF4329 domain-containing protein [Rhodobacteraceae bacterium]|nr:DUF4329 domain-containing protein [Paracoccaceae bacterium]